MEGTKYGKLVLFALSLLGVTNIRCVYEMEACLSLQRLPGGEDGGSVVWRPERT